MLQKFILILSISFACLSYGQGADKTVSVGERVSIPNTGFSITPPANWEVMSNVSGASLLFKAPKKTGNVDFQPTIQVMVFNDPRYIDDVTEAEFGKLIVEKLGSVSNRITNYRLRNQEKVTLESGDPALLYYTEFMIDDIPLMQMHILISSADHHFLMSYTDFAKVFESDNSDELSIAYTSMHSALLETKPPSRYQTLIWGGSVLGAFLLFFIAVQFYRRRQMSKLGDEIEREGRMETSSSRHSRNFEETNVSDENFHSDHSQHSDEAPISKGKSSSKHSSHFVSEPPQSHAISHKSRPIPVDESGVRQLEISYMPESEDEAPRPHIPSRKQASQAPNTPRVSTPPATAYEESEVARLSEILPQPNLGGKHHKKLKLFFWQKEHDNDGNLVSSVVSLMEQPESDLSQILEKKHQKESPDEPSWALPKNKESSRNRSNADNVKAAAPKSGEKTKYDLATSGNATIAELSRKGQPISEDAWNIGKGNSDDDDENDDD